MISRITTGLLLAFLLTTTSIPLRAQGSVSAAEGAYRNGRYAAALDQLSNLEGLLAIAPLFDQVRGEDRDRVLFDLARCRLAMQDSVGARIVLGELFRNDEGQSRGILDVPKDAALVSVLAEMKLLRRARRQARISATSPLKASARSLILPGWGQRYRGHKKRGTILTVSAGALAVGWFLADQAYQSALNNYRLTSDLDMNLPARTGGPDDPNPFEERFARAKSRASTARALGLALASIWAYSVVENFVLQPGRVTVTIPLD